MRETTSLASVRFTENRLKRSDAIDMVLEAIERFEPCTEEEIIECFGHQKRIGKIQNVLRTLERDKKIYFLPRTKTFCIRRDD